MTQQEFAYLLEILSVEFPVRADDIMVVGMKDLEGRVKQRVFNEHRDSADTSLGNYKNKEWKRKRVKAGLQVSEVDLQYTGALKNSLTTGQDNKDAYLYFNDDHQYEKATGQEVINGKKKGKRSAEIWNPTDSEQKEVDQYILEITEIEVEKILNKFL